MDNLKKFATEADYSAATLNYPAVSWVVSGDTIHFDKTELAPVNDKIMFVSYGGSGYGNFVFYNMYASSYHDIVSITLDDVEVNPLVPETENTYNAAQVHIAKYTISATTIEDWADTGLGPYEASEKGDFDFLIPSQITEVNAFPYDINNLVIEATTPPLLTIDGSDITILGNIYVPDDSVNTYKAAEGWNAFEEQILPISDYEGNLPV